MEALPRVQFNISREQRKTAHKPGPKHVMPVAASVASRRGLWWWYFIYIAARGYRAFGRVGFRFRNFAGREENKMKIYFSFGRSGEQFKVKMHVRVWTANLVAISACTNSVDGLE